MCVEIITSKIIRVLTITVVFLALVTQPACADIGLILALQSSWKEVSAHMMISGCHNKAGREFCRGKLGETSIVVVRSPMGKVNNAITAQVLLSSYPIDAVISLSPAGAIDPKMNIGDLVVAKEVYQHDFGTLKPYGLIWDKVPDGTGRNAKGYNHTSREMRDHFMNATKRMKSAPNRVVEGIVVSGDQFISSVKKREWLGKKFAATAVDMGAAAIAQVCHANNIPVCIVRVVTDRADTNARPTFSRSAGGYQTSINLHNLLQQFVSHLPEAKKMQ